MAGSQHSGHPDSGSPGKPGRAPLTPLIHGRVRLLILSFLLSTNKAHLLTAVRDRLGLTDGTLSVNLAKLEEGRLVSVTKAFVGKRPVTRVKITAAGRRDFARYIADLKAIVPGLGI